MARLHILRSHSLNGPAARALVQTWVAGGTSRWGLTCEHTVAEGQECITFAGPGLRGQLWVRPDAFELEAQLGILLSAYRERIETEIQRQLDQALG